jgi:hypothetical protein
MSNPEILMPEQLLFTVLVLLDRLLDPDCGEIEHYEIDQEIQRLQHFMHPTDSGYFQAVLDIAAVANSF